MRRSVLSSASLVIGLLLPTVAMAQNAPPPIDVPTTPVPQEPPPPPPAAKPKPAPAPAPAPAPGGGAAAPEKPKESGGEKEPIKYNNEGVFKISGSKGKGWVGSGKAKQGAAGKTAATGKAGAKKVSTAIVAQWPGFRMTDDGGSEVIVEFSRDPVTPTEHKAAGSLTYVFKGAHVIKHNNQNPLITLHFNTPVGRARLVPKKGELHLVIDFRAGKDASPSSGFRASSDGDGKQFFVKFPAGSYLPQNADEDEIGPAPTQKLKGNGKGGKDDKSGPGAPPPTTPPGGTAPTGPQQ